MKNTLKVVLVDDEALIRLDIREMLTEEDMKLQVKPITVKMQLP